MSNPRCNRDILTLLRVWFLEHNGGMDTLLSTQKRTSVFSQAASTLVPGQRLTRDP